MLRLTHFFTITNIQLYDEQCKLTLFAETVFLAVPPLHLFSGRQRITPFRGMESCKDGLLLMREQVADRTVWIASYVSHAYDLKQAGDTTISAWVYYLLLKSFPPHII